MRVSPGYAAILRILDDEKWMCIKCIAERTQKEGQHRPTATALVYRRIGQMITDKLVEYSSGFSCRNPLCKSRYHTMVHRLTPAGVALRKSAMVKS